MPNRLANETSPYLRQHQHNPVDWFGWGAEAFAEAKNRDVPVLLSVGYSACHWCHVMAHECFEDAETASMMNRLFVNIKVDREERPDVDSIYMDAVQAMSGRGGWPMTVFMSHDGRPFFGGTYFPKPSFLKLMTAVDDAWRTRRAELETNMTALTESIGRTAQIEPDKSLPDQTLIDKACENLLESFDPRWGGFGAAPKFPSTMNIDLLLRKHRATPSAKLETVITTTLDAMASGGMYDHLGGGFARYSVDEKWLVPHFEKMLYDQALLLRVYAHAAKVFPERCYEQICVEIVEYVVRDLRHPSGGFFSAEDADSLDDEGHSHEGHFYVFTPNEVREILPPDEAEIALDYFEMTELGNFEGKNIPTRLNHRGDLRRDARLNRIREKLLSARGLRTRPLLDDKVLTEWNAMMTVSLAESASLLNRPQWLALAEQNGEFLHQNLRVSVPENKFKWMRSWQESGSPKARHHALAADLAHLVDAFTRLGEATGRAIWFERAAEVADQLLSEYWDVKNGGLFTVANEAETLVVRQKDLLDNATPSANSTAATALIRLGSILGDDRFGDAADQTLRLFSRIIGGAPSAFANLLMAANLRHTGLTEIVVAGRRDDLVEAAKACWLPGAVLVHGERFDSPLWHARTDGLAYVCRDYVCSAPVDNAQALVKALGGEP
ncbi:MAG: thioredoxin domain-containing protein [Actinobacteria bacterium]|nr:thioredoxin domain-containing protein [Actinomycetota bacterium]